MLLFVVCCRAIDIDIITGADIHLRFPSSTNLWSECKRLAFEAVEFSLGLLWNRYTPTGQLAKGPTAIASNSSLLPPGVDASSLQTVALLEERKSGDNSVVVLVANTANVPMMIELTLGGEQKYDDHAVVLFGNPPSL